MTLTSVVLPAPFGPISPCIDPFSTSSDTPSTARTPPKWRWTSSRRRSTDPGPRPPRGPDQRQAAPADDALRPEDDDRNQEHTDGHVEIDALRLEDVRKQRDDQRADHRPEHRTAASEHGEGQDLDRAGHAEGAVTRVDKKVEVSLERAGVTGEHRAQHERDQLVARDVDPLAEGGDLVLPDR